MNAGLKRAYWPLTAVALAAYFCGWAPGIQVAVGLTALHTAHYALQSRSAGTLEVQVRAAYLGLLLLGLLPWLSLLHVALFLGLAARIAFDYCLLARILALAPWNRTVPLSWELVQWVFRAPPAPGSILARMSARAWGATAGSPAAVPAPRD